MQELPSKGSLWLCQSCLECCLAARAQRSAERLDLVAMDGEDERLVRNLLGKATVDVGSRVLGRDIGQARLDFFG